jgi:hypothetical protein
VGKLNLLGLKFLRLHVRGERRSMYLPLFVRDRRRFAELVDGFAGRAHPLAVKWWESIA